MTANYAYIVQFVAEPTGEEGAIVFDARPIQRELRRKYGLPLAQRGGDVASPAPD